MGTHPNVDIDTDSVHETEYFNENGGIFYWFYSYTLQFHRFQKAVIQISVARISVHSARCIFGRYEVVPSKSQVLAILTSCMHFFRILIN